MRRELAEFLIEQRGLAIRCDWGPQYIADAWINEDAGWGSRSRRRTSRARVQRGDRAVQPHAHGAVRVPASLRELGAGARAHRGVDRTLQPRVAHRPARASHTGVGPSRRDAEG